MPLGGYLYSLFRGYLYISLYDVSAADDYGRIQEAELELLSTSGGVLARARTDPKYGTVELQHPEVGFCTSDLPRAEWHQCSRTQSSWIMTWAKDVAQVRIRMPGCDLEHIPVSMRQSRESAYTWWVPHPHIGGSPYTYYSLSLRLDVKNCRVAE